jgi:hypothetical protein
VVIPLAVDTSCRVPNEYRHCYGVDEQAFKKPDNLFSRLVGRGSLHATQWLYLDLRLKEIEMMSSEKHNRHLTFQDIKGTSLRRLNTVLIDSRPSDTDVKPRGSQAKRLRGCLLRRDSHYVLAPQHLTRMPVHHPRTFTRSNSF